MDQTYKIAIGQEEKVSYRNLRMVMVIMLIVPLITVLPNGVDKITIEAIILTYILAAAVLYGTIKFSVLMMKSVEFIVTDSELRKRIAIEESQLNFFQKFQWKSLQNKGLANVSIRWEDIGALKDQGHSLFVKSKNASSFFGSGIIVLPKEIDNFDKLEEVIRNKVSIQLV